MSCTEGGKKGAKQHEKPQGVRGGGDSFFPIHPRVAVGDAAEGRGFFSLLGV